MLKIFGVLIIFVSLVKLMSQPNCPELIGPSSSQTRSITIRSSWSSSLYPSQHRTGDMRFDHAYIIHRDSNHDHLETVEFSCGGAEFAASVSGPKGLVATCVMVPSPRQSKQTAIAGGYARPRSPVASRSKIEKDGPRRPIVVEYI